MLYFFFFLMIPPPPTSTLFPYTTLFRSNVTITVNSTAAEPEQEIQVIEPLDSVSPSTPRSQTRRSDGNAQSAVLEILDRKSTRLNSSHRTISYAVFCLKKKKKTNT